MELKAQALRAASAEGLQGDALSSRALEIEANPPSFKSRTQRTRLLYSIPIKPSWSSRPIAYKDLEPGSGGPHYSASFLFQQPYDVCGQRIPILAQLSPKELVRHRSGRRAQGLGMATNDEWRTHGGAS